jgi:hypothetical protein
MDPLLVPRVFRIKPDVDDSTNNRLDLTECRVGVAVRRESWVLAQHLHG